MAEHYIVIGEKKELIPISTAEECDQLVDIIAFQHPKEIEGIHYLTNDDHSRYGFKAIRNCVNSGLLFSSGDYVQPILEAIGMGYKVHRFTNPKAFFKWAAEVS